MIFSKIMNHAKFNHKARSKGMQSESSKSAGSEFKTKLAPAIPWDMGSPVINGACIYGASPDKDFLYLIPATGERPVRFSAKNLPDGLFVEQESGRIKGKAKKKGTHQVLLTAENKHGKCSKTLKLVIDDNALALTPPMGWNSWNCYRQDVDDAKIRAIADGMVSSGLAARGYSYVNIDSGWQSGERGGTFNSVIPKAGFPDMKALCDHIHSLGLKAGIYSCPYVIPWGTDGERVRCGTSSGICDTNFSWRIGPPPYHFSKYVGIDKHEQEDVRQWSDWGFDYFKYDWAETDMVLAERMSRELRKSARDIVFSVTTNVSINDALKVKELANLWRANGDTAPVWESVLKNGFDNQQWNPYIGAGHWFDLDMTAIRPRDGKSLNQNELISCVSCWMMRPSPILIDCEPASLDSFMLSLLCNEEIIAVNQDMLGRPAASLFKNNNSPLFKEGNGWDIQIKPLSDGNYALAFFNLSETPGMAPKVDFGSFFGLEKFKARDLWSKEDLGVFEDDFEVGVDARCGKVFKIFPL